MLSENKSLRVLRTEPTYKDRGIVVTTRPDEVTVSDSCQYCKFVGWSEKEFTAPWGTFHLPWCYNYKVKIVTKHRVLGETMQIRRNNCEGLELIP